MEYNLSLNRLLRHAPIHWHGVKLNEPDWGYESHSLAFTAGTLTGRMLFHWMLNAYHEPLEFELPRLDGTSSSGWRRWIDTSLESPDDICNWAEAVLVQEPTYVVAPWSVVMVFARVDPGTSTSVLPTA